MEMEIRTEQSTPWPARLVLILFLAFVFFGLGYYFRIHQEESSPIVIQQISNATAQKQMDRFKAAASFVADAAHLQPGQATTLYVYLVERFAHPCPLSDANLRIECRKILDLAQSMEVVGSADGKPLK